MAAPTGGARRFMAAFHCKRARRNRPLDDNPSLKTVIDDVTASACRFARRKAAIETDAGRGAIWGHLISWKAAQNLRPASPRKQWPHLNLLSHMS
jgi:hypothetical protein